MCSFKITIAYLFLLAFIVVSDSVGYYDQGPNKTPLLCDYFDNDPKIQDLVRNVETHHLYSTPYLSGRIRTYSVKNIIAEGNYDLAIKELHYVLERICNHPKALEMVGDLAIIVKDPMLGVFYYKRAIMLYPQYAITHYQFGSFLVSIGQLEEGIEELKQAVDIEPSLTAAHAMLSKAYARKGDVEHARMAEEEARKLGYKGNVADRELVTKNPGGMK